MKIFYSIAIVAFLSIGFYFLIKKEKASNTQQGISNKAFADSLSKPEKNIFVYHDPNPFLAKALKEFEGFINTAIANRQAPGAAIVVVKDTSIIFLKGYGLRDTNKPDSVNTRTIFRIGSVSKSISATLAAVLVNEGVLHWDDTVINYLPAFKLKSEEATKKITLRHVLSHTMGLPYHAFTNLVEHNTPLDTLINNLHRLDLVGEPGQVYSYQNVGFSLIGKIIEAATQKKFEEALSQKLFLPLQMKDASATYEKIKSARNVAMPHFFTRPSPISDTYYSVAPAGGVNASAQDLGVWLKLLLGNRPDVLPKKQIDEIFEPQVKAIARNHNFWQWKRVRQSYYALGWRIITFADDTIAYHGGFVNNYRCEVAVNRKKKIAIALLVNSPGMLADRGIPAFFKIYEHYLDSINRWKPKRTL